MTVIYFLTPNMAQGQTRTGKSLLPNDQPFFIELTMVNRSEK